MHWSQIRTILWLRWRLTRNQWARTGRLSIGISIAVMILLLLIGLGGGLGGFLAGAFGLAKSQPAAMLGVYDALSIAFLIFWIIGILSTIQRSESIDIGKLLHLPVSLKGIFLVNYVASHVTLSIVVFLPAMLGLALGLTIGRSGMMIAMVPLILGFLFMITAWTYHLRGWLVMLMRNPRRYRAVVAGVTMAFVLLSQLPNLLNFEFLHKSRSLSELRQSKAQEQTGAPGRARESGIPRAILLAHRVAPPLWIGQGAMSLAEGDLLPAVLAAAASVGIGGLGLARAYRSTCRFYEGRSVEKKTRSVRKERAATSAGRSLLERRLPGIPEDAAAMALASLQSFRRATEVKMALAYNVVMLLAFGGTALFSHSRTPGFRMQLLSSTGIALLPFLGMVYLMTNQFGFDRSGFRTLVLSPMPRWQILLGKNLALLPVAVVLGLVYLGVAALGLRLGAILALASMTQLTAAFFLICIVGNLISSLLPYRIREGTLAATKVGAAKALLNFLAHMIGMAILSVLFLPAFAVSLAFPADGLMPRLTYLILSVAELAVIGVVYGLSLSGLGELLQQREREILRIVTQEVE